MAMVEDGDHKQPSAILHYCKICNRGFGCGGALGGHMRAHNIAEVIDRIHEPQPAIMSESNNNNKHSYFLRTTSNRFTNFRSSLPVDGEDEKVSPISSSSSLSEAEDGGGGGGGGGKRAYIWKSISGKDDEMFEDFGASREEEDLANFLVRLSNNSIHNEVVPKGLFQCKACKKVFNSHQALGGHRASHKKVKGCYAARLDNKNIVYEDSISHHEFPGRPLEFDHNADTSDEGSKRKSKQHECSICHRVYSSGQALGGHKRCHWLQNHAAASFIPLNFGDQFHYKNKPEPKLLDLNLPPPLFNTTNENSPKIYLPPKRNNNTRDSDEKQENYQKRSLENSMRFSLHAAAAACSNGEEEGSRDKKLAKLSHAREMELDDGGPSSPWLQVGLASTATD